MMKHKIITINLMHFKKRITRKHFKQRQHQLKKVSSLLLRHLPRTCLISVCPSAYACYNKLHISWSHLNLPSPVACGWDNIASAVQRALKSLWSATTKKKKIFKIFGPNMDLQSKYWSTKQYIQSLGSVLCLISSQEAFQIKRTMICTEFSNI